MDTSYELYAGCLSAEHTIKRLMRYCASSGPPVDVSSTEIQGEDIEDDVSYCVLLYFRGIFQIIVVLILNNVTKVAVMKNRSVLWL